MRAVDIISKKRDGGELSSSEISFAIRAYTSGELADYQMSALLMAIYLRGMTEAETLALTDAMLHSGEILDLSDLGRPLVDKHSTGGVGDKTSLVIAPVVAAAGVLVPMMSGRALGHSGGTLDKLESIPGFRTDLSLPEFRTILSEVGVAMIGQTREIAPADKKLYALRDVTGTVACRPLMAASIMSKKLAEGAQGLVFDVKTGSGAFLKNEEDAIKLAHLMRTIALGMNRTATALITDMNQPLGREVGNSLEVIEAFETLKGGGPEDFSTLCRELVAEMLVLAKAALDSDAGREICDQLISSGAALAKMREIIQAQGGDARVIDDYNLLPRAQNTSGVTAMRSGFVQAINTEVIGSASMLLGAGRARLETPIDHAVGLTINARIGDHVDSNSTLAVLHYSDDSRAEEAAEFVRRAYEIGAEAVTPPELIRSVIR